MRVCQLLELFPQHSDKYEWFLKLSEHVEAHEPLVPQIALDEMLALGIIEERKDEGA